MCCQKNRNILRGLKVYFFCHLLSVFCFFAFISCDKQEMIINSWNLQTVLKNGQPLNDSLQFNLIPRYTHYNFYYANSLNVSTFASGQLTSSSNGFYEFTNSSTIRMRFTLLYQRYEITAKIKKLTRNELNLEYEDNGNTYFLKLFAR